MSEYEIEHARIENLDSEVVDELRPLTLPSTSRLIPGTRDSTVRLSSMMLAHLGLRRHCNHHVFTCRRNDRIVGWALLLDDDDMCAGQVLLYVDEPWRRQGIGSALVDAAQKRRAPQPVWGAHWNADASAFFTHLRVDSAAAHRRAALDRAPALDGMRQA